jgi:hypothetical protein
MRYVEDERKDEGCIFCLGAEAGDDETRLILATSPSEAPSYCASDVNMAARRSIRSGAVPVIAGGGEESPVGAQGDVSDRGVVAQPAKLRARVISDADRSVVARRRQSATVVHEDHGPHGSFVRKYLLVSVGCPLPYDRRPIKNDWKSVFADTPA